MKKNEKFEVISALMDDALLSDREIQEAIDLLLEDIECQQKWEEYNVIRLGLHIHRQHNNIDEEQVFLNKSSMKVYKIGLSLVATITVLGVGVGLFLNQNDSFKPDYDTMATMLLNGNSKVAITTFMSDRNKYDVIDDVEYVRQQRSLDNDFLRVHESSSNTGGIIRVSFPSRNSGSVL
ncbi:MAG: hypothetical protein GKC53_05695 [Neisseriaceae bacterium]|nr:MAG: hypothetical protein GKC53_05695 [Neisseriaceae bacterium]